MADSAFEGGPDDDGELLQVGSGRPGRLARMAASRAPDPRRGAVVVGLGLTALVAVALGMSSGDAPKREPTPKPAAQNFARISIATVRDLTTNTAPLAVYVRPTSPAGACAVVRVSDRPTTRISHVLSAAFPGFLVRDAGRTIDENSGLCSIEVRATHRRAVVVVRISSPAARVRRADYVQVETGIDTEGALTTKYALALTPAGWTVLVGASGPNAALPRAADLVRMAQDPTLRW